MFRPWLQLEWFRKITNYQKKLVYFQKFSDEVMDGVMPFSLFLSISPYFVLFTALYMHNTQTFARTHTRILFLYYFAFNLFHTCLKTYIE